MHKEKYSTNKIEYFYLYANTPPKVDTELSIPDKKNYLSKKYRPKRGQII